MAKRKHKNPQKDRKTLADSSPLYIYGSHAVRAAVENPKRHIKNLYLTENAAHQLAEMLARRKITPEIRKAQQLASLLPADAVHQGMVLETAPLPEPDLADLAASGKLLLLMTKFPTRAMSGPFCAPPQYLAQAALFCRAATAHRHPEP